MTEETYTLFIFEDDLECTKSLLQRIVKCSPTDTLGKFFEICTEAHEPKQPGRWELYRARERAPALESLEEIDRFVDDNFFEAPSRLFRDSRAYVYTAKSSEADKVTIATSILGHRVFVVYAFDDAPIVRTLLPAISEKRAKDDRDTVVKQAKNHPAPSTGVKTSQMRKRQTPGRLDALYNGRPDSLSPTPIAIYHPVFSEFATAASSPNPPLTAEELKYAANLISVASEFYMDEAKRQDKMADALAPMLGNHGVCLAETRIQVGDSFVKPDCHTRVSCVQHSLPEAPVVAYTLVGEWKLEIGDGGCDPLAQAGCVHTALCSADKYESIRAASCCPAFLIAFIGPYFAIQGAVFADRFMAQHLTDLIYLGPSDVNANIDHAIVRIASIFRALGIALDSLEDFYKQLPLPLTRQAPTPSRGSTRTSSPRVSTRSMSGRNSAAPLPSVVQRTLPIQYDTPSFVGPAFLEFKKDGTTFKLQYKERLDPRHFEKAVFKATCTEDGTNYFLVVVKFARTYSKEAHALLQDLPRPLAPRLWFCDKVLDLGSWWVVVMDYIPEPPSTLDKERVKADVREAVEVLHGAGIAHGDLRDANVVMTHDGAMVVDFDWSGRHGEVKYPATLNRDIDWPDGATPLGRILCEHDDDMLDKFEHWLDGL